MHGVAVRFPIVPEPGVRRLGLLQVAIIAVRAYDVVGESQPLARPPDESPVALPTAAEDVPRPGLSPIATNVRELQYAAQVVLLLELV